MYADMTRECAQLDVVRASFVESPVWFRLSSSPRQVHLLARVDRAIGARLHDWCRQNSTAESALEHNGNSGSTIPRLGFTTQIIPYDHSAGIRMKSLGKRAYV